MMKVVGVDRLGHGYFQITADGMFGIFLGHTYIITDTGREIVDDFPLEFAVAG